MRYFLLCLFLLVGFGCADTRQDNSVWVIIPHTKSGQKLETIVTFNSIKEIKEKDGKAEVILVKFHEDDEKEPVKTVLSDLTVEQMNARWEKAKANVEKLKKQREKKN